MTNTEALVVLKHRDDFQKGLSHSMPDLRLVGEAIEVAYTYLRDNLPKVMGFKRGDILKCTTANVAVVFDHFETVSYPNDSFRAIWDSVGGYGHKEENLWNSAVFRLATDDERKEVAAKMAKTA